MHNIKFKNLMSITIILLLLGGAVLYCLEGKNTIEIAEAEELSEIGKVFEENVLLQQQMSQVSKQEILLSEQEEIEEELFFEEKGELKEEVLEQEDVSKQEEASEQEDVSKQEEVSEQENIFITEEFTMLEQEIGEYKKWLKKKKSVFSSGNLQYAILEKAKDETTGKVAVIGLKKAKKTIVIPKEVEDKEGNRYEVTRIEKGAFFAEETLEKVEIPQSVELIKANVFVGCKNLKKIEVAKENKAYKVVDNTLYTKSGKTIIAVIDTGVSYLIPKGVINITEGAFVYCPNLKTVIFPETIKKIGAVFCGSCPNIENVIWKGKTLPIFVETKAKTYVDREDKSIAITVPSGTKEMYIEQLANIFYSENGILVKEDPNTEKEKIYLTFDDGPSENTEKILDILKEHNAKATFFVLGKTDEFSLSMYKRIVEEGHSLGVHSTTHDYKKIYKSLDALKEDYITTRDILWKTTGIKPTLYRFPGGSSNSYCVGKKIQKYMKYFNKNGVTYVDWNASNEDANGKKYTSEQLVENVFNSIGKNDNPIIVLMHDTLAKTTTVEALPKLLEQLEEKGYACEALDEYVGKVQHRTVE